MIPSATAPTGVLKRCRRPSDTLRVAKRQKVEEEPSFAPGGSIATFLIGPENLPAEFQVHKEVACYHSEVFKAAFNSEFVEGKTQTYRIEDVSPATFQFVVKWFYSESIKLKLLTRPWQENKIPNSIADYLEYEALIRTWIFGYRYAMPRLQNYVIRKIDEVKNVRRYFPGDMFETVCTDTARNSVLRRYLVASLIKGVQPCEWEKGTWFEKLVRKEMLADMTLFLVRVRISESSQEPL